MCQDKIQMWYFAYWVLNISIKLLWVLVGRSAVDIWWWPFWGWSVLCLVSVDWLWWQWHLDGSRFSFLKNHPKITLKRYCAVVIAAGEMLTDVVKLLCAWYIGTVYKHVEIKRQLDATDDFYCRSYCLLNMFRAPLCPSSGAREYYASGCCLWFLVLWFSSCRYGVEVRVMCPVCGLLQQHHVILFWVHFGSFPCISCR